MAKVRKDLEVAIPHYGMIKYVALQQKVDLDSMGPNEAVIFTDYAAQLSLEALEKVNSSTNAHAVDDVFVVLSNRREVEVCTKEGSTEKVVVFDVDVHHFFAETFTKGKKNDHAMHLTCLYRLVEHLRDKNPDLDHITVWSDNAPNQYKCRQNFMGVTTIEKQFKNLKLTHRLAVKSQFKGCHDGYGKDPAMLVRKLERNYVRTRRASEVFQHCVKKLECKTTKWNMYEAEKNPKLREKGTWGMNSRTCWFVTEHDEELQKLDTEYPGKVIKIDRSFIMDTHGRQSIDPKKCEGIHEVCSVAQCAPAHPQQYPTRLSDLMCSCSKCQHSDSTIQGQCSYIPWRNTRVKDVRIETLSPKEGKSWVGKSVVCLKPHSLLEPGELHHGTIKDYTPAADARWKWDILLDTGKTTRLDYRQTLKAMKFASPNFEQQNADKLVGLFIAHPVNDELCYATISGCSNNGGEWSWAVHMLPSQVTPSQLVSGSLEERYQVSLNYAQVYQGTQFYKLIASLKSEKAKLLVHKKVAWNISGCQRVGTITSTTKVPRQPYYEWSIKFDDLVSELRLDYRGVWKGMKDYKSMG